MTIYNLYIFDRHCQCIYYQKWSHQAKSNMGGSVTGNSVNSTSQTGSSRLGLTTTSSRLSQSNTMSSSDLNNNTGSSPASNSMTQNEDRSSASATYLGTMTQQSGLAAGSVISIEEEAKLVYGVILSLRNFVRKLTPTEGDNNQQDGFISYRTSTYRLHYYETPTGLKFVLNTDPSTEGMQPYLKKIYVQLYVEYVVKNGLMRFDDTRWEISQGFLLQQQQQQQGHHPSGTEVGEQDGSHHGGQPHQQQVQMPQCSPKKNHPCEGCRERKKKCSGEYPCARCHRLGHECVFLRPTLPPDHAYVDLLHEQELSLEVETLKSALVDMERTMIQLRCDTSAANNNNIQHKQPLTSRSLTSTSSQQQQQQQNMIQNWQLILGKHGVTVNTSIKSYSDLLKQVELWQQACQSFTTPPLFRSPSCPFSPSGMVLRRQLPLWLLRRGYYMAITICVKSQQNMDQSITATFITTTSQSHPQHYLGYHHDQRQQQHPSPPLSEHDSIKDSDDDTATPPWTILAAAAHYNYDPDKLCRHILDTFFACYIVRYTILHQSTFYRLFVTPSSLLDSPVICAVCAVALTVRCRHMLPLVPYQHQAQLADLLYRRARDLMDFDEPTLATFIVLTFLAMYKQSIFCVEDATFYLDLAFRTRCLLVDDDDYNNNDDKQGERELIKRLHWALWETQTSVEYYKNQRGVPQSTTAKTPRPTPLSNNKTRPENPIVTLLKEKKQQYRRKALPDEPPAIHRSLRNAYYRSEMMAAQGPFLGRVRFGDNDTIDVNFLAQTEYRFNKAYQNIPTDCRLPPTILEEGLSDAEFRQRLDALWTTTTSSCSNDVDRCMDDNKWMAAMNMTIQYFQGVISLYESFLPDLKDRQCAQHAGLLKDDGDTPCFTTSASSSSSTNTIEATDNSGEEIKVTMHQHRAQQKCTHAAITIVRLLDYQQSLPGHCRVNVHVLLTAWDIHMRNACLGMALPPGDGATTDSNNTRMYFDCLSLVTIHQARRSLLQCLSILRDGYLFNFAEHAIWKYYEHVEQLLMTSLSVSSPPTAPAPASHWIPF